MSVDLSGEITAIATAVLALFAIVTPICAPAFIKQVQEVRAIEQQLQDAEELTRQQAELLKVQHGPVCVEQRAEDAPGEHRAARALDIEVGVIGCGSASAP